MNSRLFTALGITSALTLNMPVETQAQNQSESFAQESQPNILLIMVDDLVPALHSFGLGYAVSPNIDQLVSQSTIFNSAYCSNPVCGASRASMFTGLHPTPERFTNFRSRADEDVPEIPTIPEILKNNGYTTISLGKIFHNQDDHIDAAWSQPPQRNFIPHSAMLNPESENWIGGTRNRGPFYEIADVSDWDYLDGMVAQKAMEELGRLKDADNPFFLAVGFMRPHLPFYAPRKYWEMYDRDEIPLAPFREKPEGAPENLAGSPEILFYGQKGLEYNSDEYHRIAKHGYLACVSYVDALIGYLLEDLEKNGLADNTVIILVGDHGFHLGEHNFWGKHNLLHQSLHTPMIVARPGQEHTQINTPVSLVDLAPTILDLVNIEKPGYLHGQSLINALDGKTDELGGIIYSRFNEGDAVLDENWIYVEYHEEMWNNTMDEGILPEDWTQIEYDNGNRMLLDRQNDPLEERNAVNDPENSDVVKYLKARLQNFRKEAQIIE